MYLLHRKASCSERELDYLEDPSKDWSLGEPKDYLDGPVESFQEIPSGSEVFMRYKTLPFAREVYTELDLKKCTVLSNSYHQHKFLASAFSTSLVLSSLLFGNDKIIVPKCYNAADMPYLPEGAYVLKGDTNSRKSQWNTHMFAATKAEVPHVFARLCEDSLIGSQEIVIRPYIPLKTITEGINGLPVAYEYRVFFYKGVPFYDDYYWSNYYDSFSEQQKCQVEQGETALQLLLAEEGSELSLKGFADFVCVDLALSEDNRFVVVDVNDGQMAGLPENLETAEYFYVSLLQQIRLSRLEQA